MHDEQPAPTDRANTRNYWHANLRVVGILLTIWFVASFVISIFFIEAFNEIKIGSLGLGFWFAQQGSIFVFVVLVLVYALAMDVIDHRYHVDRVSKKSSDRKGAGS